MRITADLALSYKGETHKVKLEFLTAQECFAGEPYGRDFHLVITTRLHRRIVFLRHLAKWRRRKEMRISRREKGWRFTWRLPCWWFAYGRFGNPEIFKEFADA